MATWNSQQEVDTKFYLDLYENLLLDFESIAPEAAKTFRRDFKTLSLRVAKEGLSFLTKVLPKLGKSFDRGLDDSLFVCPSGFKKSKKQPAIPAMMQGMLNRVFTSTGVLRPDADPIAIRCIRDFCYLAYKLEIPYTPGQENAVIDSFLANEEELRSFDYSQAQPLIDAAREIIEVVLRDFDPKDIRPKHGPGAVATGERLDQKWVFKRLYNPIHQKYPYYNYFVVGSSELLDRKQWYMSLSRQSVGIAKVVLVPKDSRGPRLISCEPLEYQWIQQGLNRKLVAHLEYHWMTRGHINFSKQSVNQQLALESSSHRAFCTLDLKDASDRVTVELVNLLFPKGLVDYFMAVRSHATTLPDDRIVALSKYAPMGSAVCFSVEALIFWALCVAAVSSNSDRRYALNMTYVYGDDIIVPTTHYDHVIEALESAGLKVNKDKSFSKGPFRESCGVDAFNGINVTPTKIRTLWSREASNGRVLSSYAAYANDFDRKGYERLANFVWKSLSEVHGNIPYGFPTCGYPHRSCETVTEALERNIAQGTRVRFNTRYQRYEVYAKCLKSKTSQTTLDGWPRLLRFLNQGVGDRPDEVVHPHSTKITRKWRPLGFERSSLT